MTCWTTIIILVAKCTLSSKIIEIKYKKVALFLKHYNRSFHFPGNHTPTADEVRDWYVPMAKQMLMEYPLSEQ